MAGLPKSYIKKYGITKKAWREYRKSKRSRSKTKKSNPNKKKGGKKMARRSMFNLSSIFKYLRLAAFIAPALSYYSARSGDTKNRVSRTITAYAGINTADKFDLSVLAQMWLPLLMTSLVTVGIPKLNGIIRKL